MQPGAVMPEHDHSGDEECMVLEGDMQVNGVAFGPGDFQVGYAGSHHPHVTTHGGCLCMISVAA
jgi:anti-sigma factor ChrR (cupin superfamily)